VLRLQPFTYHRPRSLGEALELLDTWAGNVLPIAGGTDLMPNMKHRLFSPGHLVALRQLRELRGIDIREGHLVIGAAETLNTIAHHPLVMQHAPSLARAAGLVAGPQLRMMGTIGGNICLDTRCTYYNQTFFWRQALGYCLKKDGAVCHVTQTGKKCVAAHSADSAPVLMTLGASVELAGNALRTIPVSEFFVADGIHNTVRRADEILLRVHVPLPPPGMRASFRKLRQRNAIDFPLLNVAVAARLQPEDVVETIDIVVSALGAKPRALTGLDRIAHGRKLDDQVIETLAQRAFQQCHPLTNIIVDPDWRRAMVTVYVRRALQDLLSDGRAAA
jgi:4-hydroxybenzoyl-CoA reductase subunit beta